MSSSYKVKKARRAKKNRQRKLKLYRKLSNPKYRVAFHELGHAVIIKSFYPRNKICLSIQYIDGQWIGSTSEPEVIGQPRDWQQHSLISIAGAVAETYYTPSQLTNAYRVLTTEVELTNDYSGFGKAYVNFRRATINCSAERELSQFELFEKNYFEALRKFRQFGIIKMHKVAQLLVRDLYVDDERIWLS